MKVRFIRSTLFEGVDYAREGVYDLPEETAKALGSDVVILEPNSTTPASRISR